jgi:two-component system response regulator YesN
VCLRSADVSRPAASHPKIAEALRCIEEGLSDPTLTVEDIATRLGLHPTYLSRLFTEQTGQRMSRFIAARRIEKARHLLATTDWQIKRVALETGHANPNWFCHIFQLHTGLSPREYRRNAGTGE